MFDSDRADVRIEAAIKFTELIIAKNVNGMWTIFCSLCLLRVHRRINCRSAECCMAIEMARCGNNVTSSEY
jgi:hypothetical protein